MVTPDNRVWAFWDHILDALSVAAFCNLFGYNLVWPQSQADIDALNILTKNQAYWIGAKGTPYYSYHAKWTTDFTTVNDFVMWWPNAQPNYLQLQGIAGEECFYSHLTGSTNIYNSSHCSSTTTSIYGVCEKVASNGCPLYDVENGVVNICDGLMSFVTCNPDAYRIGRDPRICTTNSSGDYWSTEPQQCYLYCPPFTLNPPSNIQFFNDTNGKYTINSYAKITCNSGYYPVPLSGVTIKCLPTGLWETPASCAQSCEEIYSPDNGYADVSDRNLSPNSTASFSCADDFILNGSSILTCQTNCTWDSTPPTCDPNQCLLYPCQNNGNCSMNTTGYTCQCPSPYFGVNCTEFPTTTTTPTPPTTPLQTTVPPDPLPPVQRTVATVAQSLGCTALLILVGVTFGLFFVFRIISLERMLHMFQEVALFTGHCIIFFTMKIKLTGSSCSYVGIFLQYTFLVNFAFLTLETLQTFSVLQNVVSIGGFFSWKVNLLIGLLAPAGITLVTAISSFKHYPSTYSCWVNLGNQISYGTILPVIFCVLLSAILTEAATMGDLKRLPLTPKDKYTAALVSQKGFTLVLAFNIMSWMLGMSSLYYQNLAAYSTELIVNALLGVVIFIFHTLSNDKVHYFLKTKLGRRKKA